MQTVEDVEKHVPVREGEYGDRVATVEPGGVEYIALRERHGKPFDLFPVWISPNLEFATIFIGVIAVAFEGLNLWQAALAIILGSGLGAISHAVLSSFGPKFGVPMMVVSRGPFGFLGNILPAGLNGLTASFGWFIVNSVSGAFAIQALFGGNLPFWLAFLVVVVAQVLVAALGHNLIHVFERWAFPVLGIVFAVACIFIFANGHYDHPASPVPGGWLLAFTAAFGYAVGWNPFAADYSRYMPPTVDRRMVGIWAGLGVFIGCIVLELAGAVLVTVTGFDGNGIPTAQLQHAMPDIVYYPTLLCIALGAVAANALNIYSGTMSLVSLGIREMGLTLRQRRAAMAVIVGIIGFALGLYFQANVAPGSKYEFFLLLISYWIAPWLAVMFVDYWVRKGDYGDESLFYNTSRFRWQGVAAMAIGLVVSVYLFANVFGVYVGPIPSGNANVGDITFIVGFVITAVLYYVFSMVSGKETVTAGSTAASRP